MTNNEANEALLNARPVTIKRYQGKYRVSAVIKRVNGKRHWFQIECKDLNANSVCIVKAEDIEYA